MGLSVLKQGKSQANRGGWSCKGSSITRMGMVWHFRVRIRRFLNFSITSFPLSSQIKIPVLLSRGLTAFKGFSPPPLCNFDSNLMPSLVWHPVPRLLALGSRDLCPSYPEASVLSTLLFSEASYSFGFQDWAGILWGKRPSDPSFGSIPSFGTTHSITALPAVSHLALSLKAHQLASDAVATWQSQ